jgi:hypothetical protein
MQTFKEDELAGKEIVPVAVITSENPPAAALLQKVEK